MLVLLFSIPAVQTKVGKYATDWVNEEFGTNITINKIGLQFNGDVELKEIHVVDYKDNTLINIGELNTSIVNIKNFYNGKLTFGDIDIDKLEFNIRTYQGENDTNLDIFVEKFEDGQPSTGESNFLLSSSDVTISNSHFKLIDENKETPVRLDLENLNINATNFVIKGPNVNARINQLAFRDSRGLTVSDMKTNFEYTLSSMNFSNLVLETPNSKLDGNLKFLYSREDFSDFENNVRLKANFKNSKIMLDELNVLYNEFGKNKLITLNTELSGTLNNLQTTNLKLQSRTGTTIDGDILFKNLFSSKPNDFRMAGDFKNLSSNYNELTSLLPNVLGKAIPSTFERLGNFKIVGKSIITEQTIDADLEIDTKLGFIKSNLEMTKIDNIDDATYKGNIVFDEFDLGTFLEDSTIGKTSFNIDVDGKGFKIENLNTKVVGEVYNFAYNNYNYEVQAVSGNLQNKIFNGKLQSKDKNIDLDFDGLVDFSDKDNYKLDFKAKVKNANLKALKFVTRDSLALFSGNVTMNMSGKTIDDARGSINFNNTFYKNENNSYYFKDFAITSKFLDNGTRELKVNSPEIIEGTVKGKFVFKDVQKLIENSVGSIYTNYKPHDLAPNQFINYNLKIYSKIAEVFVPNLRLAPNTTLKGHIESNSKAFKLKFKTPRIAYDKNFAKSVDISIDNSNPLFNTYINIDSLNTKYYAISDFNFINTTKNDSLFVKTEFKGGETNDDIFDLNMYYTINDENKSVVGFKKSDITFKGNQWFVNNKKNKLNKIIFDRDFKNFNIEELFMNHNQEIMKLSGFIQEENNKDLKLDFVNVDLKKILPEIDSLALGGNLNGKFNLKQISGNYLPQSKITIDDFEVNKFNLGSFKADIEGNQSLTNYNVDVVLKDDNTKSFSAKGNIEVAGKKPTIDLNVNFDKFILDPLNPFGEGVITKIRGDVTGQAKVSGSLNLPQINGNLELNNGGLEIPYLNVNYDILDKAKIGLQQQSFVFQDATISDVVYNSQSKLGGFVSHVNFSDWELGLQLNTDRLLVLNTTSTDESLYYGTAFVGGSASITGPVNQLVIAADVQTEKGTEFKIPLDNADSFGDNTFIHFLSPEEKLARQRGEDFQINDISGLELEFNLAITDDAEVEIIIDQDSGHALKGKGQGDILIEINTNDKFNMYGDFVAFEGVYNFVYGGVIQKQFIVEPGGTIAWDGNPLKSKVDMKAVYKTQANPSVLLDNAITQTIPVDVEILLSGDLEQPTPDFNLAFPNVSSTIKSELDYRLEDKENRDLQAISLVTTGSFISKVSLDQQAIYGNLAERASAIINSLFSSDNDNKLKLGIDYQIGEVTPEYETQDRLGVTLQTKITDRIILNGKVGVPIGGVSESIIAGDAQIDFLLNEEGTLTAKVFNRQNSIRNFGEEIGYTQGIGLSYNIEFDTFKEFIDIIVKGKKKVREEQEKEAKKTSEDDESLLPSYVKFKKRKTKNN